MLGGLDRKDELNFGQDFKVVEYFPSGDNLPNKAGIC